jgi:hypothetical protein
MGYIIGLFLTAVIVVMTELLKVPLYGMLAIPFITYVMIKFDTRREA